MQRPEQDEYEAYFSAYIDPVPTGDISEILRAGAADMVRLLEEMGEERSMRRYAEGKWSPKQIAGHLMDAERTFSYRALAFARGDAGPLPGLDQDVWMTRVDFESRPLTSLVDEMKALRSANVALFDSFDEEAATRRGVASGVSFSARSFAWIIAGHELRHARTLRDRYMDL